MKQSNFRPRDLLNQEIAGICGVARLTDKARADHVGEIGSYKYGADSEQDTEILSFLGISAEVFKDAAVRLNNDLKLGAWILNNCDKSSEEVSKFNRKLKHQWQRKMPQNGFSKRRRELNAEEPSIPFWVSPQWWLLSKIFKR
ncbi:MAG: DUF5069 domain-containing protein [Candidatus Poribacteria bacterium]|nr:DUF5069 domain-containing protein [Candidatus Poribacteria bacterium]MDE0317086.1 DUF5069 domain-containing protein [Candidatus Poribacteria bacterium]